VTLTDTERAYLRGMADGLGVTGTAERLGVGYDSVRHGLMRARRRFRARNTAHLVYLALRAGELS
jgi:DNA-binding CsgD family transcriptional regulator